MRRRSASRPSEQPRRCVVSGGLVGRSPGRRDDGGLEPGDEVLDLGLGATEAAVELIDDRGGPLQAADQLVDVEVALLEEGDDLVELAARLGVRSCTASASFSLCAEAASVCSSVSPAAVDHRAKAVTSANRVTRTSPSLNCGRRAKHPAVGVRWSACSRVRAVARRRRRRAASASRIRRPSASASRPPGGRDRAAPARPVTDADWRSSAPPGRRRNEAYDPVLESVRCQRSCWPGRARQPALAGGQVAVGRLEARCAWRPIAADGSATGGLPPPLEPRPRARGRTRSG